MKFQHFFENVDRLGHFRKKLCVYQHYYLENTRPTGIEAVTGTCHSEPRSSRKTESPQRQHSAGETRGRQRQCGGHRSVTEHTDPRWHRSSGKHTVTTIMSWFACELTQQIVLTPGDTYFQNTYSDTENYEQTRALLNLGKTNNTQILRYYFSSFIICYCTTSSVEVRYNIQQKHPRNAAKKRSGVACGPTKEVAL